MIKSTCIDTIIRRIWFDDKLVYDASGASVQIEVPGLVWRFYPGNETQLMSCWPRPMRMSV